MVVPQLEFWLFLDSKFPRLGRLGRPAPVPNQSRAPSNNEVARSRKTHRRSPEKARKEAVDGIEELGILPVVPAARIVPTISVIKMLPHHRQGQGQGHGHCGTSILGLLPPFVATIAIATDFCDLPQA